MLSPCNSRHTGCPAEVSNNKEVVPICDPCPPTTQPASPPALADRSRQDVVAENRRMLACLVCLVTCDSWLLLTSRLQPLLLLLWEGSRSECENWQHRKPPESQRVFTYPVNEGRPHGSYLLLAAGGRRISYLISCVLSSGDSYDRAGIAGTARVRYVVTQILPSNM